MVPLSRRAAPKKRILMLVAPKDFYEPEYFAPRKLFVDEGFDVDVASGEGAASGAQGTQIAASSVADADQADYDGLFVVGGKGMIGFSDDANAQRLLRKFLRAKKPVALICHAPLLAAKARIAAGKEVTGWPDIQKDMEKAGAKWTGMPVERDDLLFTAVGPDDAESLAFALASAVKGEKMLARSEACILLDTTAVFKKLAAIRSMAAAADEDDEEEFLRQLEQYEEEFGLEPVIEPGEPLPSEKPPEEAPEPTEPPPAAPEEPEAPAAPPAAPPEPEVPAEAPKPLTPRPSPKATIRFEAPRTDGYWPELPPTAPAGFPFPPEVFQDITAMGSSEEREKALTALTALFSKQSTWDTVRAAAVHPLKKAAIQEYLVPAVTRLIGKAWWDSNRRAPNLKGAPFGLFDKRLRRQYFGQNISNTTLGRSAITQINMELASILSYAVSALDPRYDIVKYLYKSLHNNMVMFAAKTQGFELHKQAACAYCRWKLKMDSMPPKLELVDIHDMRGKGLGSGLRERMIYKCPRCEDMIENLKLQIESLTDDVEARQESLRFIESKLEVHPDDERSRKVAEELRTQIASAQDSLQDMRTDISARVRLSRVPYQHIVCINPDCPGKKIPLTFIDWNDESWQAGPVGERRVGMIAEVFDIHRPRSEEAAADDAALSPGSSTAPDKPFGAVAPPQWLWRVPFVCPYDGARFTPEEAFGKGYRSEITGQPLGGLIVDAVRTNLWRQGPGAPGRTEDEAERALDKRTRTDNAEIAFYNYLAPSIRMELLRKKDEYMSQQKRKGPGGARARKTIERMEDLYDAVLEWSFDNPEGMMGYFVGRAPTEYTRSRRDAEGNIVQQKSMGRWHKKRVDDIVSAIWQTWFQKMLERYGSTNRLLDRRGGDIGNWLTNVRQDGVPPEACFIGKVERLGAAEGNKLIVRCQVRTTSAENRSAAYGKTPRIAWLMGMWKYPGTPNDEQMERPVDVGRAAPLMSGSNMIDDVDHYDFSSIVIDASMTGLKFGDHVICRAMFLLNHRALYPMKQIMWLRRDFNEDNDFMEIIGRIADGSEEDAEVFEEWIGIHRELGLPGLLEDFDRRLKERRKKG